MASIQLSRDEAEEGDLPDVCMCCGAPAMERKRRRFISHPLWVYLLLPWGYILYAIVAAILTEHVRCYTVFCERHKKYWMKRTLLVWGAFAALIVFLASGLVIAQSLSGLISQTAQESLFGSICIATPVLLLCWVISIPLMQLTAIHPGDVTRRHLTLKRVSPEFVEAVREHRAQRCAGEEEEDRRRELRPRRSRQIQEGPDDRTKRAHSDQQQEERFHPGDGS